MAQQANEIQSVVVVPLAAGSERRAGRGKRTRRVAADTRTALATSMHVVRVFPEAGVRQDHRLVLTEDGTQREALATASAHIRVQAPDACIEDGSEGYPGPVGRHEPCGTGRHTAEDQSGGSDCAPQHHNLKRS